MAVADAIADLVNLVDLAKTTVANYDGTYAGILSSIGSATEDDQGRLARWAKDERGGYRAALAQAVAQTRVGAQFVLQDVAREIARGDITEGSSPVAILTALRTWMLDNSKVLESRAVTHNAVSSLTSPLSSSADGLLILRSTDDQSTAVDLEAINDGTLRFECVRDQAMGVTEGSEIFRVYATDNGPTIDILGGIQNMSVARTIAAVNAGTAQALTNGNLEGDWSGDGDDIPGWTLASGTASDVTPETTTVFRGDQAIKAAGVFKLTQKVLGLRPTRPVIMSVRYNRSVGSAKGGLVVRVGGVASSAVTLSGASSGWQHTYVVAWPRQYSGGGFDVEIEYEGSTESQSGTLYVDEVICHPLTRMGGRYFVLLAGATAFARRDYFTQQSTVTGTGLIKEWLHRWFGLGFELPHDATPSSGWEDPT